MIILKLPFFILFFLLRITKNVLLFPFSKFIDVFRKTIQLSPGSFYVIDGDTIKHGDMRLRFMGMDAPEMNQPLYDGGKKIGCAGTHSRNHLLKLIDGKGITCKIYGNDKYGRLLVTVFENNRNICKKMILDGYALSSGNYKLYEMISVFLSRGIHKYRFHDPVSHRNSI